MLPRPLPWFCAADNPWQRYTSLMVIVLLHGCAVTPKPPIAPPLEHIARQIEPIDREAVMRYESTVNAATPLPASLTAPPRSTSNPERKPLRQTATSPKPTPDPLTTEAPIWPRVIQGFALPDKNHPQVHPHQKGFKRHPETLVRALQRAEPYFYHIVNDVERRGMPMEITLLPVVESAFQPFAYSHSRAAGIWQFIPATARRYGLTIDWWHDQRRDILSATRAALDYLEFLHQEFDGDWLLALAAYNSGEGTVMRAIGRQRRTGGKTDFWSLDLPKETRGYVPRLLAVADVIAAPQRYRVSLPHIPDRPLTTLVGTADQIDVALAARLAGLSIEDIYRLNPGINRWATHPHGPHHLLLPWERAVPFAQAVARIPPQRRPRWQRHTIQRGETLERIARRFGTTVQAIRQANHLTGSLIRAGDRLIIPIIPAAADSPVGLAQTRDRAAVLPGAAGTQIHTVRSGDSLWEIARRYNVDMQALARWNGLRKNDTLRIGQRLVVHPPDQGRPSPIPPPQRIHYIVRQGDSLAKIARKFNVSIRDLTTWNAGTLGATKTLRPGQRLVLYVDVTRNADSG